MCTRLELYAIYDTIIVFIVDDCSISCVYIQNNGRWLYIESDASCC